MDTKVSRTTRNGFPSSKNKVRLTGTQETMLGTLVGRAQDATAETPLLNDKWASLVIDQIDYDFERLKIGRVQSLAICMRSRTFDRYISEFIRDHKSTGATIVCLACGLDSRCLRLMWGENVRWVDVDLPDVVDLRQRLLPAPQGEYKLVAASVHEHEWLLEIPADRPTMVVMEGLVMYMTPEEGEDLVERVVKRFPSGQLAFDAVGSLMIAMQSWVPMFKATGTVERWGLDSPHALEQLDPRLKLLDVVRFSQQDGANDLGFPVWYVAWALSNVPYLKDIGYILRYEF